MFTLFYNTEIIINSFKRRYKTNVSAQFVDCMDHQLTNLFKLTTGLNPNKNVQISLVSDNDFYYIINRISSFPSRIFINHNWNPVTILWTAKSGRVYEFADTDIDCDGIEFWFEGLDPALYHKQLYPNDALPFKLKDLSYELVVTRLNLDCSIEMLLKDETYIAEEIIEKTDAFIADFNERSEKKDRKYGVIHNWKRSVEDHLIIYDLDLGSAGFVFFKKLLRFLSDLQCFQKVEVG